MALTTTLVWDAAVSQPVNAPHNDGQEGIEIYGNFLYATDFVGGTINGIAPTDKNYLTAAIAHRSFLPCPIATEGFGG